MWSGSPAGANGNLAVPFHHDFLNLQIMTSGGYSRSVEGAIAARTDVKFNGSHSKAQDSELTVNGGLVYPAIGRRSPCTSEVIPSWELHGGYDVPDRHCLGKLSITWSLSLLARPVVGFPYSVPCLLIYSEVPYKVVFQFMCSPAKQDQTVERTTELLVRVAQLL
jgi:hypothetical protein